MNNWLVKFIEVAQHHYLAQNIQELEKYEKITQAFDRLEDTE
jgi:hypothetical protein